MLWGKKNLKEPYKFQHPLLLKVIKGQMTQENIMGEGCDL